MTNEELQYMAESAYVLLCEFQIVIDNALEGDHHCLRAVDRWLTCYEKLTNTSANIEAATIEGHPV